MDEHDIKGTGREAIGRVKDAVGGLTGDTGTQAEGKLDQASGKLERNFGSTVDDMRAAASEFGSRAGDVAREGLHSVRKGAAATGERIGTAGSHAGKYVGETVQQQPLLSLIGIAAIGYLVGFLIHSPVSPLAPEPPPRRGLFR
jgi:uncharacterized protein YjbJ (UPF0337 family)